MEEKNIFFIYMRYLLFISFLIIDINSHIPDTLINKTINEYITKGDYSNLDTYLSDLNTKNISFIEILTENINNKIKLMKELGKNLSKISKTNIRVITPAYRWGETDRDIFLEIFYSHRMAIPSCGELDYQNIELLNDNMTFHFEGNCTMGDDELFFNLTLNLFKKVDRIRKIERSRKQILITLVKEKYSYWNRLLNTDEENPDNMNEY